jgi:type II secretory pathway component PulJ
MLRGFSVLEFIIVLAISMSVLTIVITSIGGSTGVSKQLIGHQQKMESICHTIEMLKSDLTKCGMRLQEAASIFNLSLFEYSSYRFKVTYGLGNENLIMNAQCGDTVIHIERNDFFNRGKKMMIFEPHQFKYEVQVIESRRGDTLTLADGLQNDYSTNAIVVALKEVEYKLYSQQETQSLKRKVNRGYFQPLLENVTDFYVCFYPEANSVFYRIELGKKEQIRGYIFLTNMMEVIK